MDHTIKSMSELEQALANTKLERDVSSTQNTDTIPSDIPSNNRQDFDNKNILQNTFSKARTAELSTSGLLSNLAGQQNITNTKLSSLIDNSYGIQNILEKIHKEQIRQTEILSVIARNTSNTRPAIPEGQITVKGNKVENGSIKDYGFPTAAHLFGEFLYKILQRVDLEATNKSKRYKSTRDFNTTIATQVVGIAISNEFKMGNDKHPALKIQGQKHPALVKAAKYIGSNDGRPAILLPQSIREIIEDVELKYFISVFEQIVDRLRIIRLLIPYYEADLVFAIRFPYFDKANQSICEWISVAPRPESKLEAQVATAAITSRKEIGKLLATGMTERAAVSAIIKAYS